MNKEKIFQHIIEKLDEEFVVQSQIVESTKSEAIHGDMKQEGKYDTRRIEASYLAGAQARRFKELEQDLFKLKRFNINDYDNDDEITIGSLFHLNADLYLLTPMQRGLSINFMNHQISIISAHSPIGIEAMGLNVGDEVEVETPGGIKFFEIKTHR